MNSDTIIHDYIINYRNILEINNIKYNINKLPKEIKVIFNIISEDIEKLIIDYINRQNKELDTILKCLSIFFSNKYNIKFNSVLFSVLKSGEGMKQYSEDDTYNSPILIMNLGSTILMKFKHKKNSKKYEILLPSRSLLIINDINKEYTREIDETKKDIYNQIEYERKDRYSLIFRSKNIKK
jgi:hypothetical protein